MTTSNTYGRQVVIPLTNKSGGSVAAGDVVIVDTSNNDAFTTTTTGAFTGGVGIAMETIANNAVGRILISGYAALVNTSASVTRGNYGKTHTVVKQAVDAGSSRVSGTFCLFLTGGTTPDAFVWQPDLGGGSGLTDPMTTRGDFLGRNASNVTARFAVPAAGKFIGGDGTDLTTAYPPGYEYSYVENTSGTAITATVEASADTIVTAAAFAGNGSTVIWIEFFAPDGYAPNVSGGTTNLILFDGSSPIGIIADWTLTVGNRLFVPVCAKRKLTPSNASHTYSIRGYVNGGTGGVEGGAGGAGTRVPIYIRITQA